MRTYSNQRTRDGHWFRPRCEPRRRTHASYTNITTHATLRLSRTYGDSMRRAGDVLSRERSHLLELKSPVFSPCRPALLEWDGARGAFFLPSSIELCALAAAAADFACTEYAEYQSTAANATDTPTMRIAVGGRSSVTIESAMRSASLPLPMMLTFTDDVSLTN